MQLDEWVLCRIFSKTGPPSPGPNSDSPPADIPLLGDLLAQPDNLTNIMYAPPPAANIMYAPPAPSVPIQNNNSSSYYYTDDSDMYPSSMLLANQEEAADDQLVGEEEQDATYSLPIPCHCHWQQNIFTGDEAICEPEEAMTNDKQIDSMLMDQAFFGNQHQQ